MQPLAVQQLEVRLKLAETHKSAVKNEIHNLIQSEVELGSVNCWEIAALAGSRHRPYELGQRNSAR